MSTYISKNYLIYYFSAIYKKVNILLDKLFFVCYIIINYFQCAGFSGDYFKEIEKEMKENGYKTQNQKKRERKKNIKIKKIV